MLHRLGMRLICYSTVLESPTIKKYFLYTFPDSLQSATRKPSEIDVLHDPTALRTENAHTELCSAIFHSSKRRAERVYNSVLGYSFFQRAII
jgi:hypothetical protein